MMSSLPSARAVELIPHIWQPGPQSTSQSHSLVSVAQTLPSSSLAHSWACEAGAEIFGWGVLLGCCPHGHFRGLRPPSALPGPGSLQARVFHILSPFLSLSRGQWRPEESEDYVSNRCASTGKTWVRWACGPLLLPCLSFQPEP